jgi:hypothetical protein
VGEDAPGTRGTRTTAYTAAQVRVSPGSQRRARVVKLASGPSHAVVERRAVPAVLPPSAGHSEQVSHRFLPLLFLLALGASGCTTVAPAPLGVHDHRPVPRASFGASTAPPMRAPAHQPSGHSALVRTRRHLEPARQRPQVRPEQRGRAPVAPPRDSAAPGGSAPRLAARRPAAQPPAPGRAERPAPRERPRHVRPPSRPEPRPKPVPPQPDADRMRELCRQAEGIAAPGVVNLCHSHFG